MMMDGYIVSKRKVAVIGAGFVGASIAYALTIRNLAREIVRSQGGYIKVSSKKGEGSVFSVFLPSEKRENVSRL